MTGRLRALSYLLALYFVLCGAIFAVAQVNQIPGWPPNTVGIGIPQSLGVSSVSGATLTTSAAIVAGDLAVVCTFGDAGGSGTVTGITDGTNTYAEAASNQVGTSRPTTLWYKANAAAVGSGATITATYSTGIILSYLSAWRVTNIALSSPLDQTANAGANSVITVTATTPTLSQANEIAAGCSGGAAASGIAYSGATGFSPANSNTIGGTEGIASDYKITTGIGAVSYSPTWANGNFASAVVATFKGR